MTSCSNFANYTGDILLIAFFPVHESGLYGRQLCGAVAEEDGIQMLEAFHFTLDEINRKELPGLPKFSLGGIAFDSCSSDAHALEQGMNVIRILMTKDDTSDSIPYVCHNDTKPILKSDMKALQRMIGVVGASSSGVTMALANMFRVFNIPQISPQSTSSDISNVVRFPYLARTVPSDSIQVNAILSLLRKMKWTFVSIVYENSNYGTRGFYELSGIAALYDVCFEKVLQVRVNQPGLRQYKAIISALTDNKNKAKAVIVYLDYTNADYLFEAADQVGLNKTIYWLGVDGWAGRMSVVKKHKEIVNNALAIQPYAFRIPNFDEYFQSLKPFNNTRNPWFKQYWEYHFNCSFNDENRNSDNYCDENAIIGPENGYEQIPSLHYVYDAVQVFVDSLSRMYKDICGSTNEFCSELRPGNISGSTLIKYIRNSTFTGISGVPFYFQGGIDGPPRYSVLRYTVDDSWHKVGVYTQVEGEYTNQTFLQVDEDIPTLYNSSICSEDCGVGEIRKFSGGIGLACCWSCIKCPVWSRVFSIGFQESCVDCPNGTKPDDEQKSCIAMEPQYIDYTHPVAIASLVVSSIGLLIIILVGIVMFRFRDTPVIKASSRELSALLLGACAFCCISSFIFLAKPSRGTCGASRFLVGFCYAALYAPILTKTNRVYRLFPTEPKQVTKKTKLTSPKSQMFIVLCLLSIEVFVLISWLVALQPTSTFVYPSRDSNILICKGLANTSFLVPLIYPLLLMLACTYYAIRTRKTPDGFNETKFIAFTSYSTWVIWVAFLPTFFVFYTIRPIAISLSVTVNALIAVSCIFAPKVYICIFRPHKNTREAVMSRRTMSVISAGSGVVGEGRPYAHSMASLPEINLDIRKNSTEREPIRNRTDSVETYVNVKPIAPKRRKSKISDSETKA
ncbi:DgyrCDS10723 [Dimorphilus gyrociliatus]|uniref:DgyrCDS10723 n=1 Tax=Dimorphilus gyrociliatus TaxID=2664684 RepID=A0A7I8W260_9ANNE|nr:DgyrCDS10723 [Dimorphilus gyrociliatus]